jgi:ribulose-phosphate 3-epimerase
MKQAAIIAPSILSANFAKLGEEINAVLNAGAGMIHFDVMDNHFVPNLTIGAMVLKSLRTSGISADIDVHLMVEPVDRIASDFAEAGATLISFHPEASANVRKTIEIIKQQNVKVGLALNPDKPLENILEYLPDLDFVLLMTVFPGFGGQAFMPEVLSKITQTREAIDKLNKPIRLEVDGGIKLDNIADIARHGADTFVAGSAIFKSRDYRKMIGEMLEKTR